MDITPTVTTTTTTTTNTNTASTKSPEADSETPTRIHKPLAFSNGILKRHNPHHHHHHHHLPSAPVVVTYKECQKNHAASLGGHALDGCGEFMPSPTSTPTDPTSLKCAACGCHRNFHRREPEEPLPAANTAHVIEYQPHHRHHPPPPPPPHGGNRSPSSSSPPPISSSYYPSAPHMLLALSTGLSGPQQDNVGSGGSSRKRFRSKFSQEQKEKMHRFAERVGWKMQKRDEEIVQAFCNEIGVEKGILKVWMHNNKNTFGKKDVNGTPGRNVLEQIHNNGNKNEIDNTTTTADATATAITTTSPTNNNNNNNDQDDDDDDDNHHNSHGGAHVATNGSSSSS